MSFFIETSAPQNVQHVLKSSGTSLQITWDAPATYCHLITNYKVRMLFITDFF